jgi:hypothetical protein
MNKERGLWARLVVPPGKWEEPSVRWKPGEGSSKEGAIGADITRLWQRRQGVVTVLLALATKQTRTQWCQDEEEDTG